MTPSGDLEKLDLPESSISDSYRKVALALVGAIPVAGSAVSVIVEHYWKAAYEKRLERFIAVLQERLISIEGRVDVLEALQRDVVQTVSFDVAVAAARTGEDAKHRYLASAVVTVMRDTSWDTRADLASILTRLAGELTATHVRVLDLLADPLNWQRRHSFILELEPNTQGRINFRAMIIRAFPDLDNDVSTLSAVLHDLESRGLLNVIGVGDADASLPDQEAALAPMTSELGATFHAFITGANVTDTPTWTASRD